ncbi:MAG: protein PacB [Marinospirillum sp.]|uniref:hypothetical protein n=1 Tax=Marinospirillum sp. TaxID=2183934 RepID=UPI0019E39655|nr:hypothetical protein [Marinospirillum sp.]MBE0505894.1 protein PacB [Marinospirillum sp.]
MHHMLCHVKPELILTANNIDQVRRVIFKYLSESWAEVCSRFPWLRQYFTVTSELFYCNEFRKSWYVAGKTVPKQKPEGIAGAHNKNLFYIVDEASAADDTVLSVIRGALSEDNNRLLLFSQPTRNAGHFYDSQHGLKKSDPTDQSEPGYIAITLNSEESPFVSLKAIREYAKTYGGYDSPEYQIKVRGQFSDQLEGFLVSRRVAELARGTKIELPEQWGYIIVADIGGGVERDSSVVGVFKVYGYDPLNERLLEPVFVKEMPKTMSARDVGREVYQISQDYENVIAAIDSIGIGLTAAQEAEELGVNVQRIMWGIPPHSESQKRRFKNQRALAYVALRDGLLDERIRLDGSGRAIDEIGRIPYRLDERGRYAMLGKDEMRSKGIKSPDWADVYAMAMIADYLPAGDDVLSSTGDDERDDYMADLLRVAQE